MLLVWTADAPRCDKLLFAPLGRALTIGRESSDVTLAHDAPLSRRHASLAVEGDELVIRDLESKHGVYLDGERIQAAARISLARRHVLRVSAVFLALAARRSTCASADIERTDRSPVT